MEILDSLSKLVRLLLQTTNSHIFRYKIRSLVVFQCFQCFATQPAKNTSQVKQRTKQVFFLKKDHAHVR